MRREKIEGRNEIEGIFFEENPDETKRGMKDRSSRYSKSCYVVSLGLSIEYQRKQ